MIRESGEYHISYLWCDLIIKVCSSKGNVIKLIIERRGNMFLARWKGFRENYIERPEELSQKMSVNDETTDDDLSPDLDTVSYYNNSDNTWTHSDGEFSGLVMSRGNLIMDKQIWQNQKLFLVCY